MNDLFDGAEVISIYTDRQAVEDGVLVDLPSIGCRVSFHGAPVNRMTGGLLHEMLPFLIPTPRRNTPLHELADAMLAPAITSADQMTPGHSKALAATLRTKLKYARDTAGPGEQRGYMYEVPPGLWVMPNEAQGWTILRRCDY